VWKWSDASAGEKLWSREGATIALTQRQTAKFQLQEPKLCR
jgi:hypothetical protein